MVTLFFKLLWKQKIPKIDFRFTRNNKNKNNTQTYVFSLFIQLDTYYIII